MKAKFDGKLAPATDAGFQLLLIQAWHNVSMIKIREYQQTDWAAICTVHDLARPDELRGCCDIRAVIPIEQDEGVADLLQSTKLYAEHEGEVIGFVGLIGDSIAWLYVHPNHCGEGLGRSRLRAGREITPRSAWTIVLSGNLPARNLYESVGFREVHRFESENAGYPCTCLRMEWSAPER